MRLLNNLKPLIPLPPKPLITQWGTWINAAVYWSKHFSEIKEVINTCCSEQAASIKTAQKLFENEATFQQISFIAAHFSNLPLFIVSLGLNKLPLSQSMSKVESMVNELHQMHGEVGESV